MSERDELVAGVRVMCRWVRNYALLKHPQVAPVLVKLYFVILSLLGLLYGSVLIVDLRIFRYKQMLNLFRFWP